METLQAQDNHQFGSLLSCGRLLSSSDQIDRRYPSSLLRDLRPVPTVPRAFLRAHGPTKRRILDILERIRMAPLSLRTECELGGQPRRERQHFKSRRRKARSRHHATPAFSAVLSGDHQGVTGSSVRPLRCPFRAASHAIRGGLGRRWASGLLLSNAGRQNRILLRCSGRGTSGAAFGYFGSKPKRTAALSGRQGQGGFPNPRLETEVF
jgi:hypothetical protein